MNLSQLNEYGKNLNSSFSEDMSKFQNNFLLIASGLLTFSITFIKDIVKIDDAQFIYSLFISWLLLIISIGVLMWSFLKSAYASDKIWEVINQQIKGFKLEGNDLTIEQGKEVKETIDKEYLSCKLCLKKMRYLAICFFIAGFSLFAFFVAVNFVNK